MSYWHFSQWHYSTTLPPSSSVWPTWAVSYYYISFTSLPPLFHILNIQSPFFSCILPPPHSDVNEGYFESIKSMSAMNTPHWSRKAENLSTAGRTRPKLATGRKLKNIWVGGRAENWEKKKKKIAQGNFSQRNRVIQVHCSLLGSTADAQVRCTC